MSNNETVKEVNAAQGGKIVFANDVIATIAALAAADVKGVAGMSGGMVEGLTEMLGRKNLTKGVKVEVGSEEAAVDVTVVVTYGFRIQDVCKDIQNSVKNAVETMTGLRVVEVNVEVQAVSFENTDVNVEKPKKEKAEKAEKEEKPVKVEEARVK
ncbi:Asp23/Gls24 family envelope stress response protein [Eubacteriales bacterium OttesenSCG-928-K08]|nr:Asp23/Gls24 family envelope stress response protein [Eubacteriales bacterium OttesenSCG-928-K08]